jgi:2-methylcitrate dehydratase PrpD
VKNITDKFIEDIVSLSHSEIPEDILVHSRRCLIDYLGSAYAGSFFAKEKAASLCVELGSESGTSPIIGCNLKTSLLGAALINGIVSHTAELDDGVISGIVHPGTPLFSALLPYAKYKNISGANFLRGVVIGYEACVRLAESIQPSHKLSGYHATATCGGIGATVGIMIMIGASVEELKNALSASVVSAGGTLKALEGDSQLKPYNSGHAAASAISAVAMAKAGFVGPEDVLAGKFGFFDMVSTSHNLDRLFSDKRREKYAIERVYFKPYAACRYCHAPMDATQAILSKNNIDISTVQNIHVETYDLAVKGHDHTVVNNVSSAKMSIPFSVAQLLVIGNVGPLGFSSDNLFNMDILGLASKVSVFASEEFTHLFPSQSAAKVTIRTDNKKTYSETVYYPKGEPELPLTDTEVAEKFTVLANHSGQSVTVGQAVLSASWRLPLSMNELYELL